jgi:hypothetical protein
VHGETLMNTEHQNKCMPQRPTSLTRSSVSLALRAVTALPASSSAQGTLEQRLACTPDVFRLCSEFIPNADEITICLRERSAELSDACRTAFEAAMTQPPKASDGNQVPRRITK